MPSKGDDSTPKCLDKMEFLSALDSLKEQQKTSKSEITLFVDDNFYERATTYLAAKENKNSDEIEKIMTKSEVQTIKRKKWTVNSNNQIIILVTTKWFFPRVSFMKISCLHTTELHIEGDKRQNTGWNRTLLKLAKGLLTSL